jgi:hypothetical protein
LLGDLTEPQANAIEPVLEIHGLGDEDAGQELPAVEIRRCFGVSSSDGRLEVRDVAPDDAAVEREHIVPEHELVHAGVTLERVQRLRECRSRAGLVHLGP